MCLFACIIIGVLLSATIHDNLKMLPFLISFDISHLWKTGGGKKEKEGCTGIVLMHVNNRMIFMEWYIFVFLVENNF